MSYYDRNYGRKKFDWYIVGMVIILMAFVGFFVFVAINANLPEETYIAQVTDKQVKPHYRGSDNLIYAVVDETQSYESSEGIDNGRTAVLCVNDNIFKWRWNSADVFASIKVGEYYKFKTVGMRIPFLSWYPNIIEVTPITESEAKQILNKI